MSIQLTKYGTFEVRYREGRRHRSATFKTKKEATAFQQRVEASPYAPARSGDVPSLEDFAADWLAGRGDLADTTMEQYCRWLDVHIVPDLGHLPLIDLRPRRLAAWQADRLAAGAGPAVLGKAQTLLSQILDSAVLPYEYLEVNPVAALKRPAYKKREHRWLTAAEVESIRRWYLERDDAGSAALVSVLAYVGIRPQDALALRWSDLDERLAVTKKNVDGQILPGSKTGDGYRRTVYVPPTVRAELEDWRHGDDLIFPRKDGMPWSKSDFDNWRSRRQSKARAEQAGTTKGKCFKLAAEQVGLGWTLKPYDLRHTGATLYAAAGWNHLEVARQLGHSPEVSMRVYQHLFDGTEGDRRSVEDYILEARTPYKGAESVRDLYGVEGK
jgi:integrase